MNDCIRWLRLTPVFPAITAGTEPPLGVTDTAGGAVLPASNIVASRRRLTEGQSRQLFLQFTPRCTTVHQSLA